MKNKKYKISLTTNFEVEAETLYDAIENVEQEFLKEMDSEKELSEIFEIKVSSIKTQKL